MHTQALARRPASTGPTLAGDLVAEKAAQDLDDPSLAEAELPVVKSAAAKRVDELKQGLAKGSFGASDFDVTFKKAWPYAQGHFGKAEEEKVTSFPEHIRAVSTHPMAIQHGEFHL